MVKRAKLTIQLKLYRKEDQTYLSLLQRLSHKDMCNDKAHSKVVNPDLFFGLQL